MAAVSESRRRLCICWETTDSWTAADGLHLRFAGIDLLAVDLLAVDLLAVDLLAVDLLAELGMELEEGEEILAGNVM